MSIRIVISDNVLIGHPETIREAIIAADPAITTAMIEIRTGGFAADILHVFSINAEAVVRSLDGIQGNIVDAQKYYPLIQSFIPLGSNSSEQLTLTPDSIPTIITSGAGLVQNETGWGNGLAFWDDDTTRETPETFESSFSNGTICGKLFAIKDAVGCGWWEARYRARMTASNGGVWDLHNGYGKIDVAASIAYAGVIIPDPFVITPDPAIVPIGVMLF
jgi:hypothetical protein